MADKADQSGGRVWSQELAGLRADVAEMLRLRRQLLAAELRVNRRAVRRAAIWGGAGLIAALAGVSCLLVALAQWLAEYVQLSPATSSSLCGSAALILGLLGLWFAYRRFRRDFVGLRQSFTELEEDLAWLREWIEQS